MPLDMALERAGITAEDLANIQRITEERMNQIFRSLTSDSDEDNRDSSEEDTDELGLSRGQNSGEVQEPKSAEKESTMLTGEREPNVMAGSPSSSSSASSQSAAQSPSNADLEEHQQQQQQQSERQARMQGMIMPIQRLILQPLPEQPRDTMTPPMPDQPLNRLPIGQTTFGRSLAQPVRIPVPMMQPQAEEPASASVVAEDSSPASSASVSASMSSDESERPHCK